MIACHRAPRYCRGSTPKPTKINVPSVGLALLLSTGIKLPTAIKALAQKNAVSEDGDQLANSTANAAAAALTAAPEAAKRTASHLPSFAPGRSQTFPPPNGHLPPRMTAT